MAQRHLPTEALGDGASRVLGLEWCGFALWIWINWKCKGLHWASRAGHRKGFRELRAGPSQDQHTVTGASVLRTSYPQPSPALHTEPLHSRMLGGQPSTACIYVVY